MRIVLKTVYENVNEDWLAWYIKNLKQGGVPISFDEFKKGEVCSFSSKDPTGPVVATTSYQVEREQT